MENQTITANGINLHVVQDGPSGAPLVILLHGFPEFWYGWRRQLPFLANAGFRVWAPDQRGYNLSDKPDGISAYSLDELAADVVGLIDAASQEKASIVGHDWGAAVAWWAAAKYPHRFARMVVMNAPHLAVFQEHIRRNFAQLLRSWYILFFQLPRLPEFLARQNNWNIWVKALEDSSRPGTFTNGHFERYRRAWSQPGAATAMINWYRAAVWNQPSPPSKRRIMVPTLLIWGARDTFLGRELAQPSIDRCEQGQLVFLEEATHWVQHEEADRVNGLIDAFFRTV